MTKFEQIGVNYQYDAVNADGARKAFQKSCTCCCNKGIQLDCDRYSIAYVHNLVMAYFDDCAREAQGK